MAPRETILCLRVASVLAAVFFMYLRSTREQPVEVAGTLVLTASGRRLLSDDSGSGDQETDNCTSVRSFQNFNSSCDFVRQECASKRVLIDYLSFTLCDLIRVKPLAYVVLALWLFLPHLATGYHCAPDIFTAVAALNGPDDFALLLSGLIGASVFISTVVLGTIILLTNVTRDTIDRLDFIRDVTAYILVVALVIGVCFDGEGKCDGGETSRALPLCTEMVEQAQKTYSFILVKEDEPHGGGVDEPSNGHSTVETIQQTMEQTLKPVHHRVVLEGLTWPKENILQSSFSGLWNGQCPCFDGYRFLPAIIYWAGFTVDLGGDFPLFALLMIIGFLLSIVLYFVVSSEQPHWAMQIVLGIAAFGMSIVWMYLIANEVVSLMQAIGLLLGVDTADTAVARAGKPGMGVASCFGSPLLNDVLGLSISLLVTFATKSGHTFLFDIHQSSFNEVKLSWIFLAISLVSTLIVFVVSRFNPPSKLKSREGFTAISVATNIVMFLFFLTFRWVSELYGELPNNVFMHSSLCASHYLVDVEGKLPSEGLVEVHTAYTLNLGDVYLISARLHGGPRPGLVLCCAENEVDYAISYLQDLLETDKCCS
eukprot:Em0020g38a